MSMAATMSCECGLLAPQEAERVRRLLELAGLPTRVPAVSPAAMLEHMRIDKKVLGGRVRLVLLRRIGEAFLTADYPAAALTRTLAAHCGSAHELLAAGPVLAPYAAHDAQSRGRLVPESRPEFRGEFQRDRDRIIHSNAFRRLVYKTQVFVNHEGDLYRTRVTHSIEVAQIARSVALALGLNEALTEAISLAHDLGHTPFGHAGQDALNECMRDYGGFEHNLQSLRVVDELEEHYAQFRGLNLTFECREGILKHCSLRNARELGEVGERFIPATSQVLRRRLPTSPTKLPTTTMTSMTGSVRSCWTLPPCARCACSGASTMGCLPSTRIWASAAWCTRPSGA